MTAGKSQNERSLLDSIVRKISTEQDYFMITSRKRQQLTKNDAHTTPRKTVDYDKKNNILPTGSAQIVNLSENDYDVK